VCSGWSTQCHRFRLHTHRDLGVTVGRGEAHVPEPTSDDVDIDTGFQQMDGRRVSPHVRRNAPLIAGACGLDIGGEAAYALVNPKARERLSGTGYKYGAVGLRYASTDE